MHFNRRSNKGVIRAAQTARDLTQGISPASSSRRIQQFLLDPSARFANLGMTRACSMSSIVTLR